MGEDITELIDYRLVLNNLELIVFEERLFSKKWISPEVDYEDLFGMYGIIEENKKKIITDYGSKLKDILRDQGFITREGKNEFRDYAQELLALGLASAGTLAGAVIGYLIGKSADPQNGYKLGIGIGSCAGMLAGISASGVVNYILGREYSALRKLISETREQTLAELSK